MKKTFLAGLATGMLVFGMGGTASATPVSFDIAGASGGSSVNVIDSARWGTLTGALAPNLDSNIFTLNDGQTQTIDFFTLTARGLAIGSAYTVEANLAFDLPAIDSAGSGGGYFSTFFGLLSGGNLTWNPATIPDAFTVAGNSISVNFEGGSAFGCGGTEMVHAYITNHGGGTNEVPEPATLLLMGAGLVGLIGARRKMSA